MKINLDSGGKPFLLEGQAGAPAQVRWYMNSGSDIRSDKSAGSGRWNNPVEEPSFVNAFSLANPAVSLGELSKVERIKRESRGLRGTIAEELTAPGAFSESSENLIKLHGMYQYDNRDKRKGVAAEHRLHELMVRGRIPGGRLSAEQYLKLDALAGEFADGSIRLTTRQSIQYHGVVKSGAKQVLRGFHDALLTTLGACGDVVRTVTQAVNHTLDPKLNLLDAVADEFSNRFKWKSNAYAEIWLDGEKADFETEVDEIYGDQYLPRKFKVGISLAGNNSNDLLTNDLALAADIQDGSIIGYYVYAGGGLGRMHNKPETYARLASYLGYVEAKDYMRVAEAIITVQRDHGDRENRKHARLKYLIEEQGVSWFRRQVEIRAGVMLKQKAEIPWVNPDYLGWHEAHNGTYSYGLHILSGRIVDTQEAKLKTAIAEAVKRFQLSVQITADQDIIFLHLKKGDKQAFEALFRQYDVSILPDKAILERAIACPALPTCGLAFNEAERFLPELTTTAQKILDELQITNPAPVLRMTGCPNGCARPYSAELALVGRNANAYALYAGGSYHGDRLAFEVALNVRIEAIPEALTSLFRLWKQEKTSSQERFGDFALRVGQDRLKALFAEQASSQESKQQ